MKLNYPSYPDWMKIKMNTGRAKLASHFLSKQQEKFTCNPISRSMPSITQWNDCYAISGGMYFGLQNIRIILLHAPCEKWALQSNLIPSKVIHYIFGNSSSFLCQDGIVATFLYLHVPLKTIHFLHLKPKPNHMLMWYPIPIYSSKKASFMPDYRIKWLNIRLTWICHATR